MPSGNMKAGYARVTLTPSLPFPLAGMVTWKERMASNVRDAACVTTVVIEGESGPIAVMALDILIVDSPLYRSVEKLGRRRGLACTWVAASHTHSSMGGYVDSRGGHFFMGRYRPNLRLHLLEKVDSALAEALSSMKRVTRVRSGASVVKGLTMNRRLIGGPTDDEILVLELSRERAKPILLVTLPGHPVAIGVRCPTEASADVPGAVATALEDRGFLPLILPGAMGGLNLLFPELYVPLDRHIDLVAGLATNGVESALATSTVTSDWTVSADLHNLSFTLSFPPTSGGPPRVMFNSLVLAALGFAYSHIAAPRKVSIPVGTVRIGPAALAGMPADFGVGATLELKQRLRDAGASVPMVTSHTNGYLGYLHLPSETRWSQHANTGFLHYENAMNWYGADSTQRLMDATVQAAERLFAIPPP